MLYRNWDALTNLSSCGRLTKTTVCARDFAERQRAPGVSCRQTDRKSRRKAESLRAHLDLAPVRQVPECTPSSEEEHRADHDSRQHARELLRLAHRFRDGQDQPDPLERKDGRPARAHGIAKSLSISGQPERALFESRKVKGKGRSCAHAPDQEREILRVEQLDVGDSALGEQGNLVREDVDQTDDDKHVSDQGRARQFLDVADQGESCCVPVSVSRPVPSGLLLRAARSVERYNQEKLTQEDDGLGGDE